MLHKFLSDFIKSPINMAVKAFFGRLEYLPTPEAQFSSGMVTYKINGKVWIYEVRVIYPITWDTIIAEPFLGRKTSQCLFEQRGEIMPSWNPSLLGFRTKSIWIW
jgi:hypothetical protein